MKGRRVIEATKKLAKVVGSNMKLTTKNHVSPTRIVDTFLLSSSHDNFFLHDKKLDGLGI